MPFRAVCLTGDPLLRKTLRRTLQAAGTIVEFGDAGALAAFDAADLVVLDAKARREVDGERLAALGARVVVLGESLEEADVLALLRGAGIDHVMARSGDAEAELMVTSGKMVRGDIFGLEKYLAWGATVHEREVRRYDEKRQVLLELAAFAQEIGVRRQVVARIEAVADELLMNALYDAPAIRFGVEPRIAERARSGQGPLGDQPALLRYACDGRTFALSVRDNYGELRKEAIVEHLARARALRGLPLAKPGGGAGLGLYFVLGSVTGLIANIAPGRLTEMVGLFDVKATGRDSEGYAQSLHVFTVG